MLQSISSVFVVYRCKTLTGSPDPMHANGMDKPCTPPLELRLHHKEDKDTRNVELQAKTSKRIEVPVSNPRNRDLLDLDWDTNWDAALEHMRERHWKESCLSSAASRSSSTGKRHRSASRSGDEINLKKGHPTPDWEHSTPDKGNTPPHQESLAPARKFTLNWDQDILEPLKPKWRPAAKDTRQHLSIKLNPL